jgi:hypothetical protein
MGTRGRWQRPFEFPILVAGVQSAVQRKSDEMRQIVQERAAPQEVAQA